LAEGLYSELTPGEIDAFVDQLVESVDDEDKFFDFTGVRKHEGFREEIIISVRLPKLSSITIVGRGHKKIVHCITDDGQHLDLLLGFFGPDAESVLALYY
jgi:hypothetical protein